MARRKYPPLWGRMLDTDGNIICEWHPDTGEFYVDEKRRDDLVGKMLERVSEVASAAVNGGDLSLLNVAQ